ncbi:MAG: Flagellar M-ring protein [Pseudomonadota bacterium]
MATASATMNPTATEVGSGAALTPTGATTAVSTTDAGALVPANTGISPTQLKDSLARVLSQPSVRKLLPFISAGIVLVFFALTYAWVNATPYRPVMPNLQESDQQAAFDALKNNDFQPKLDPQTGQITVPSHRFHEARIFLASQGIPKAGATGLEALRDHSSMTTSQFMEQVKVNSAMQQELARSIMQIGTVHSARVHLALPKQSVFVRDRTPPKASVVVTPHQGRVVSPAQVQAIVHMISSSVPYLAPENVTVVDNVGKLLTDSATDLKLGMTAAQEQHKQQLEEIYRQRVVQILAPLVGETNVRSQVNLNLDFTQIETTTEDFDNREKGPKTRSEVLAEERGASRDATGIPGALSNSPPANPNPNNNTSVNTQEGQSESRSTTSSRSTRNYELDRTVRHVRNATGGVMRVSVAVVVNERAAAPAAKDAPVDPNAPKSTPFTDQEMERMLQLVRGAVGFDEKRGDSVTVVPAKFEPGEPMETIPWYLEYAVQTGIKSGLIALSFIVFLLIVVRPVMRNILEAQAKAAEEAEAQKALADGELSAEDMRMIQIGEGESLEEIKAKLKPKKSAISADMLDTANTYDDKVALIRMLVAEDSGRVANVLKKMIKAA